MLKCILFMMIAYEPHLEVSGAILGNGERIEFTARNLGPGTVAVFGPNPDSFVITAIKSKNVRSRVKRLINAGVSSSSIVSLRAGESRRTSWSVDYMFKDFDYGNHIVEIVYSGIAANRIAASAGIVSKCDPIAVPVFTISVMVKKEHSTAHTLSTPGSD